MEKMDEKGSGLVGLMAAAYFLGTGVPRNASDGTLSLENLKKASPPSAPNFIRYVQRSLPFWKEITMEAIDYNAAVRGWSALFQDILTRMEKGKDAALTLTGELYIFLVAIAAQKLGVLDNAQKIINLEIFDEVVASLPTEDADAAEEAEEAVGA